VVIQKRVAHFLQDKRAISEEFTSLPALAVVMIGFTLFVALIGNTYIAYHQRRAIVEDYQIGAFISTKLTSPHCFFMRPGGIVDLPCLERDSEALQLLQNNYLSSGINFTIRIHWLEHIREFPTSLPSDVGNRIAISKPVGIYLNPAQTVPGSLTVILWEVS
jgi:hypothetical protein